MHTKSVDQLKTEFDNTYGVEDLQQNHELRQVREFLVENESRPVVFVNDSLSQALKRFLFYDFSVCVKRQNSPAVCQA